MKTKNKAQLNDSVARSRMLHIVGIAAFAGIATVLITSAKAAPSYENNPFGVADYCRLEGSNTVIYGWAHDSQAGSGNNPYVNITVGSSVVRSATDIDGYRNAEIDAYLSKNNYKTAAGYGFKASFSGIYKGSSPGISGTITNIYAGADQALRINQATPIKGGPPDKFYFGNNKVPDACLPSRPVVQPPAPTPAPAPAPTPAPPSNPSPSPSGPTRTNPPPSTNTPSSTPPENEGAVANDVPSTEETFTLILKLVDGIITLQDIGVTLGESDYVATTDGSGTVTFTEIPVREYTATFTYQGSDYEQTIQIADASPGAALEQTIDVSELQPYTEPELTATEDLPVRKSNPLPLLFLVILSVLAIGGGIFLFIWKRQGNDRSYVPQPQIMPLPPPPQVQPPSATQPTSQPQQPTQDSDSTIGVSLKDLVIKSMREEAARRRDDTKR